MLKVLSASCVRAMVLAAALLAGMGALAVDSTETTAVAGSTYRRPVYWVYYRHSVHSPWNLYGGYYSSSDAARAVRYFRYHGYDAFSRRG